MNKKTDKEKISYMKSLIKAHLNDSGNPNILFAMFLGYVDVVHGKDKLDLQEMAKVITDASGQKADIVKSLTLANEMWKLI